MPHLYKLRAWIRVSPPVAHVYGPPSGLFTSAPMGSSRMAVPAVPGSCFKLDDKKLPQRYGRDNYESNYMKFISRVDRQAATYQFRSTSLPQSWMSCSLARPISGNDACLSYMQDAGGQEWKLPSVRIGTPQISAADGDKSFTPYAFRSRLPEAKTWRSKVNVSATTDYTGTRPLETKQPYNLSVRS